VLGEIALIPPLKKIVSGGQTGADRAALDAAIRHGIPHGGWCPRGRKAEDGALHPRYRLAETPSESYIQRTEWNVRDSDGTVVFTLGAAATGGSLATIEFAAAHGRPCLHLSRDACPGAAALLRSFVRERGIETLNVAGSRESREPGLHDWVMGVLSEAVGREAKGA
jgi:hypothetical protein